MQEQRQQTFHGLDHLRAFAIFFVFLFHYFILSKGQPVWLPEVAKFGWTGVDLFFVLSGFLISSQLFAQIEQGQRISFKRFFLKRFFRIIPAYVVVVAIYFCIPYFRETESLPPLWKFLTFTQNFGLNLKDFRTFSHAWSLCVEEHFYLGLPLILIVFQRMKKIRHAPWLLIGLFILTLLARYYSYINLYFPHIEEENGWLNWYMYIYYPTYTRLDGLLVGVTIAAIYRFLPTLWSRISVFGNQFILLGLAVLVGAYFLCFDEQSFYASVFGFTAVAIGYGFLVIGAICPTSFLFKWKSKGVSFIASISYAIYLTHKGVIHITHEVLHEFKLNSNLLLIFSMISCITVAYILNQVVEHPFMNFRKKLLSQEVSPLPQIKY